MNDVSLEGDITVPGAPQPDEDENEFNTLDEPVRETVVRYIWKQVDSWNLVLQVTLVNEGNRDIRESDEWLRTKQGRDNVFGRRPSVGTF